MNTSASSRRRGLVVATLVTSLLIWAARRPDQLFHPYVWVEEGTMIERWQQVGALRQALTPVNGQLIFVTSASVGVVASLSLLSFPVLAYLAASVWLLVSLLLWLVPASRLALQTRILFVLAMVLVPANPETTGVLEYSFWWATLWVVPCLFWDAPRWAWRVPVLLVAGLSSLTASTLFVAFGMLWLVHRRRHDLVSAAILAGTLALQVGIYFGSPRSVQITPVVGDIAQQSFANLGSYGLAWLEEAQYPYLVAVGVAACAAAVALALYARRRAPRFALDWTLLLVVLGAFTLLSSVPATKLADPYSAGQRYFFLPFLAVSWLAALLTSGPWRSARSVGAAALAVSLITLAPAWNRTHDHLDWRQEVVTACAPGGDGRAPVHFDGSRASAWSLTLLPTTRARITGDTSRAAGAAPLVPAGSVEKAPLGWRP